MIDELREMGTEAILSELETHTTGWLSWHTGWQKSNRPTLDLTKLKRDSKGSRDKAAHYFPFLHARDWEPLGGYPGSDKHWKVLCLRDGWEGNQFNSHMRRGARHGGCTTKEMSRVEQLRVRYRVIVNRCNPEGGLGRQVGYALGELDKAVATEKAAPAGQADMGGLYPVFLQTALMYVRQAQQYTEPTDPGTGTVAA